MDLERAIEEFKDYAEPYRNINPMCELKINHTLRVVEWCRKIAINQGLSEEDIKIARMCGLLHDIARFEQWKRYETFSDIKSIDHAEFGIELLKENDWIRKYINDSNYDEIILKAIKYHNKYRIPDELSEREKLFIHILRDADKIDILYLYIDGELELDLKNDIFTKKVYDILLSENTINRADKKTLADNLAVPLGFVFDIYFDYSIKILKEVNYINQIIDIYVNKKINEELKKQLEEIKIVINNYIEKRLENVR